MDTTYVRHRSEKDSISHSTLSTRLYLLSLVTNASVQIMADTPLAE